MSGQRQTPARCRALLQELSEYLDGDVTPARCRVIERHITTCARCGNTLGRLRQTLAACRATGKKPLPRDVKARAAQRIRALLQQDRR